VLLRREGDSVVCVAQPAHAWISGQLARAWGADPFGAVEPWEEVCLAAEQHDVGMTHWEKAPTRNPQTGLPHAFTELPVQLHLRMWTEAPSHVIPQSRYAALLVSLHGTALYEKRDLARMTPEDTQRVQAFFATQQALQEGLAASLHADPGQLRRNQRLIWTWDALSLALLLGWAPYDARDVPTSGEPVDIALRAHDGVHTLEPWPFRERRVTVRCEGRRIDAAGAPAEPELHRLLAQAPWETVELELQAAAPR
jgi:hypothetical protein